MSENFNTGDATKNGKATTGLVLGIIGLVGWFIPIIGAPITTHGGTLTFINTASGTWNAYTI